MAKETREDIFSEDHRLWRKRREKVDQQQKDFFKRLSEFPNLFSLMPLLHDDERTQTLLKRQEAMEDKDFQYELEKVRRDNLIIFFLYVLGRKQEAMSYSTFTEDGMSKSIIFLTLQAMLHWDCGRQYECSETMASLQKLREDKEHEYLRAVAESEKGYLLIVIGPKGLLGSMDLLQNSIDRCQNCQSDAAYVWKFDLALAIRRNFNTFAYSEHPQFSSSSLAQKAADLLSDVARSCPKKRYQARAKVELAKLVYSLNAFVSCCKKEEKESIQRLCKNHNLRILMRDALAMSADDHFVSRECGRQFLYDGKLEQAERLLESSYKKRKNAMICQLRGKAMIRTYLTDPQIVEDHGVHRGETETAGASYAREGWSSQMPYRKSLDSSRSVPDTSEATLLQDNPHEIARDLRPHTSDVPEKQTNHKETTLKQLLKIYRQDIHYDVHDNRIKDAQRFYLDGLEHDPRNHALLYDTGRLYEGMRKPSEALKYYERIIGDKQLASPLLVVNAYMQSGLCYLELGEYCEKDSERERFTRRAEDMFMASLVECRKAAAHLPQVSEKRAIVWDSYPEILKILHQSESRSSKTKEAKVHELVGNHLEAIKVHKEVMDLADTEQGRTEALRGIMENYLRTKNVKEAKFILDMFLTSDQREFILTDDDTTTQKLRGVAVEVNKRTARQALELGNTADAHSAFQWALVLTKILPDPGAQQSLACAETVSRQDVADLLEKFDCCVFYDSDSTLVELKDQSAAVASIMRRFFGIRISVNDEGAALGHLSFESELRLADSAPLVILVVGRGSKLSPRMTYIADKVLQSHYQSRILPILVGEGQNDRLPKPLDRLTSYSRAVELLSVDGSHVRNHVSEVCHLFDALLEGTEQYP